MPAMPSLAKRQAPPWLEQSLRQAASLASVPGLPADAVLCVRHLTARLDTHGLRQTGGLLGTADKLSRQLQTLVAEARRPAHEVVPESAAAVLFDNPAQMLACAARDWLDGQFDNRWWWRSLSGSGTLAQGAITLWRRYQFHAPAALAELHARAEEFCRRTADAEAIVARLIEQRILPPHSVVRPDELPRRPEPAPDDPRLHLLLAPGVSRANPPGPARHAREKSAPVTPGIPDARAETAGTQARQSAIPRPDGITDSHPALNRGSPSKAHTATTGRQPTPGGMDFTEPRKPIQRASEVSEASAEHPANRPSPRTEQAPRSVSMPAADDPVIARPSPGSGRKTSAETSRFDAPEISQTSAETHPIATPPASFPLPGKWIETRYGGVLYLLNVAIHLGFYPDFTQPRNCGLALSPWSFLALTGERLAGHGVRQDALWELLAMLAAATGGQPGLASAATHPPPALPEALRPYLGAQQRNASTSPDPWSDWADRLIPPLRRRLAAALGAPSRQAGRLLCCVNARIRFRSGRLDAHFMLNDHPVAIRLSGLDRDPGWIPAAACDFRFHFDC